MRDKQCAMRKVHPGHFWRSLEVFSCPGVEKPNQCICEITDRDERIWNRDCLKHPQP